jgi:hypothetical protein
MEGLFPDLFPAPAILPNAIIEFDLLRAFVWYISAAFAVSLVLRLRFYRAVYLVANHVRVRCPNVHALIHEHWFLCVKDGVVPLVALYATILVVYMLLNQLVWPLAQVSLAELQAKGPGFLALELVLIGVMLTVDAILIGQVGRIDVARVQSDLTVAERWLGGNLNAMLQFLGKWNPIMKYANQMARDNLRWFNEMFRGSLAAMIVELVIRLCVAVSLFLSYVERK